MSVDFPPQGESLATFGAPSLRSFDPSCSSCPICLEDFSSSEPSNIFVGGCKHPIHVQCASGLTEKKCPMCRSELIFPESISKSIKDNIRQHQGEVEEDDRLTLLSTSTSLMSGFIPPFQDYLAGMYLSNIGVKPLEDTNLGEFSKTIIGTVEKKRKRLFRQDLKLLDQS